MTKTIPYVCWYGHWNTPKTTTHEMAIGTKYGIMSIRVVESANGHKVDVYTGFDPVYADGLSNPMTVDAPTGLPAINYAAFWEHRYITSIEKAAKKWGGDFYQEGPHDIHGEFPPVGWFDVDIAAHVRKHLEGRAADGKHWSMLLGMTPGVSSSPARTSDFISKRVDAVNAKKNAQKEAVQSAFERRAAEDELFGIF